MNDERNMRSQIVPLYPGWGGEVDCRIPGGTDSGVSVSRLRVRNNERTGNIIGRDLEVLGYER